MIALALAAGCARQAAGPAGQGGPIFFPPPPQQPRVQFLGSVSTPDDLPRRPGGWAEFVLGPSPTMYPLVKPLAATLRGTRLFVADSIMNTVFVYDLATGEAGPLPGDRANGKIQQANNLVHDGQGRLYVADKSRGAVLVYGADGTFMDALGRPGQVQPVDLLPMGDVLYVCDVQDHEIEVWDRTSGELVRTIGQLGSEPGQFLYPTQIAAAPDGTILVTDTGNFRVQRLTREGEPLGSIGGHGTSLGRFAWPKGMDVDAEGRVYVADSRFANVQIFGPEGRLLLFFGGPGPDRGNLDLPAGVTVLPWTGEVAWLNERVDAAISPRYLVIVVSQKGQGLVNFFAVDPGGEAPS